jgi:pyruvate dehydrogenase E2 component (dihydrolipoamide acetyltransferase)
VDLARVQGSGPGGRVVRKDVEAALSGGQPTAAPSRQPAAAHLLLRSEDETIPLTKLRQAIARRMVESTTSVPHFFVTHEYKMDALMAMRKQANAFLPDDENSRSMISSSKPSL